MMRRVKIACLALLAVLACGCARGRVERVEWQVMGTVAAVQWKGAGGEAELPKKLVAVAKETFASVETLLNAHAPESELNRLAARADGEVLRVCDPLVRPCYAAAFALRDETGGVFNPRWRGAKTLDLGGIAKGFAVDLAAERMAQILGRERSRGMRDPTEGLDVLIDLGGNLKAVRGTWLTSIALPAQHSAVAETFSLVAPAACATSGEYYRGHHIRDGRTGGEVTNAVYSVSIRHPTSAMKADGLSTVLFILGKREGEAFLKRHASEATAIWVEE